MTIDTSSISIFKVRGSRVALAEGEAVTLICRFDEEDDEDDDGEDDDIL